jgi:hypothetical protein
VPAHPRCRRQPLALERQVRPEGDLDVQPRTERDAARAPRGGRRPGRRAALLRASALGHDFVRDSESSATTRPALAAGAAQADQQLLGEHAADGQWRRWPSASWPTTQPADWRPPASRPGLRAACPPLARACSAPPTRPRPPPCSAVPVHTEAVTGFVGRRHAVRCSCCWLAAHRWAAGGGPARALRLPGAACSKEAQSPRCADPP